MQCNQNFIVLCLSLYSLFFSRKQLPIFFRKKSQKTQSKLPSFRKSFYFIDFFWCVLRLFKWFNAKMTLQFAEKKFYRGYANCSMGASISRRPNRWSIDSLIIPFDVHTTVANSMSISRRLQQRCTYAYSIRLHRSMSRMPSWKYSIIYTVRVVHSHTSWQTCL